MTAVTLNEAAKDDLRARIDALEQKRYQCPSGITVDDAMRRARLEIESKMVNSARWKWVPDNYYQQPLTKRAQLLGVPSTQYLCKSLVLENKRHNPNHGDARTNPQFVLVVLQYEATLDVRKLLCAIRALRPSQDRIDVSDFDWRVASTEDNDQLTGFAFNSVTPFGLLQPVPIVLADAIVPLGQFWMGGGHELLKLGMAVSDFIKATGAWVADVSQPRNADDDEFDLVDCK